MRILMIRHGDPDYEHDSLTETGEKRGGAAGGDRRRPASGRLLCLASWPGKEDGVLYAEETGA